MATKWENAELYLLFLSFLILIWLILRSNIGKNKMSLLRWYTPSFNCLAATMGIDRDRPQSVMEALIIALPFGLPTAMWSPLQSNCLYPSRSRLRWFFIRGSITMADCLFYRGISSKYRLFLLLTTNYSHCRVLSYSGDTTFHEWLLGHDIILMSVALVDSNQRS